jgi:transposase
MDTNFQPITSENARGHYRQHPLEFKRALVALSLEPGASVARIAREHCVNANQRCLAGAGFMSKGALACLR